MANSWVKEDVVRTDTLSRLPFLPILAVTLLWCLAIRSLQEENFEGPIPLISETYVIFPGISLIPAAAASASFLLTGAFIGIATHLRQRIPPFPRAILSHSRARKLKTILIPIWFLVSMLFNIFLLLVAIVPTVSDKDSLQSWFHSLFAKAFFGTGGVLMLIEWVLALRWESRGLFVRCRSRSNNSRYLTTSQYWAPVYEWFAAFLLGLGVFVLVHYNSEEQWWPYHSERAAILGLV